MTDFSGLAGTVAVMQLKLIFQTEDDANDAVRDIRARES